MAAAGIPVTEPDQTPDPRPQMRILCQLPQPEGMDPAVGMAPTAGLPAEAQMLPGTDPLAGDPDVAAANQAALMGMDMGAGDAIARAREAAAQPDAPVEEAPEAPGTALGEAASAAAAFIQGGAQAAVAVPKTLAVMGAQDVMTTIKDLDRIDRGERTVSGQAAALGGAAGVAAAHSQLQILDDYRNGSPEEKAAIREQLESRRDPTEHSLFKLGTGVEAAVKELVPTDPAYEGRFSQQLGRGAGSMAAFVLGAILTRARGWRAVLGSVPP